jgi:hypothetical protein
MNKLQLDSDNIDIIYPLEYITAAAESGDVDAKKELAQRLIDRAKYKAKQATNKQSNAKFK